MEFDGRSYSGVKFISSNSNCYYCGNPLDEYSRTVDHILPKSRGGVLSKKNKVYSCLQCNQLKGDMTPDEFLEFMGGYVSAMKKELNLVLARNEKIYKKLKRMVKLKQL
jgi:5-methylcytosine-specific restriction endonuclease McrA